MNAPEHERDRQSDSGPQSLGNLHWRLPCRDTRALRVLPWVLMGAGVFLLIFLTCWIAGPVNAGVQLLGKGQWIGIVFLLFGATGLLGVRSSLRALIAGWRLKRGRSYSEVKIENQQLVAIEALGWFDWRRHHPIDSIVRFVIENLANQSEAKGFPGLENLAKTSALIAEGNSEKDRFTVIYAYPNSTCQQLADQLAQAIPRTSIRSAPSDQDELAAVPSMLIRRDSTDTDAENQTTAPAANATRVQVVQRSELVEADVEPVLPADSAIRTLQTQDGFAIELPSPGLVKGSHGIFPFAVAWNAFMVTMFSYLLVPMVARGGFLTQEFALVAGIGSFFLAAGAYLMWWAVRLGTARHMMAVLHGGPLVIESQWLMGKTSQSINQADILDVWVGASGAEINDRPINCLLIETFENNRPIKQFEQMNDEELQWVQWQVKHQLHLPSKPHDWRRAVDRQRLETGATSEQVSVPPSSPLSLQLSSNHATIEIPANGIGPWLRHSVLPMILIAASPLSVWIVPQSKAAWIVALVILIIGLTSLVAVTIFDSRRYRFTADASGLTVKRSDVFRDKTFQWPRRSITAIDCVRSGFQGNDRVHWVLQIEGEPTKRFLQDLNPVEVAITAHHLNRVLSLTTSDPVERDSVNDA